MNRSLLCKCGVLIWAVLILPAGALAVERLELVPQQTCVTDPSGQVIVEVWLYDIDPAHPILAANLNLAWNPNSCWQAIDIVPGAGFDQFGTEKTMPGAISYSITRKLGQPGITVPQAIALVTFQSTVPVSGCCVETINLAPGSGAAATKVVGAAAYSSVPTLGAGKQIRIDAQAPVIVCAPDQVQSTTAGLCTWKPTSAEPIVRPTVTDNCTDCAVVVTFVRSDGKTAINNKYAEGETFITWTATDCCGNSASCVQRILVEDNEAPVISPDEATIEVSVGDDCTYTLPDIRTLVTITDNCDPDANVEQTPPEGTVWGPGTYQVAVNANDSHQNNAEAQFTFVVKDTTPPVFTLCPQDIEVYADAGKCTAKVTWLVSATDNCNGPVCIVSDPPVGYNFPIGTTPVTCTATDKCGGDGNVATCTFNVTVLPKWLLNATVQLKGRVAKGPFTRCVAVELEDCDGVLPAQDVSGPFTFVNGLATGQLDLPVPSACVAGKYTCGRAKDIRFSLWSTVNAPNVSIAPDGKSFLASWVGADALVLGDVDNSGACDVLDWIIWMGQFLNPSTIPSAPADVCSPFPDPTDPAQQYADLTGDGIVSAFDFSLLYLNNIQVDDPACCVKVTAGAAPMAAAQPLVINRVSIAQLKAMGMAGAAALDSNGDGFVDKADMSASLKVKK